MNYKKYNLLILLALSLIGITSAQNVRVVRPDGNVFTKEKLYAVTDTNNAFEVILGPDRMPIRYNHVIAGSNMSTAALGPKGGLKDETPLSFWYANWRNESRNQTWYQLVSGTTKPIVHRINWPFSKYRDGAEVNQLTGEIYLSADTVTRFENSPTRPSWGSEYAALAIWNPATNHLSWNHRLNPIGKNLRGWRLATDMAIDAEGNMFILVRNGANTKLVKVNIPRDAKGQPISQDWNYSIVQNFKSVNNSNVYGMAFLNGLLYTSYENREVYVLNPLTGESKKALRPSLTFYDMASAQVAPLIRGTVYEDKTGKGDPNDFTPAAGITVEIWKDGTYIGNVITPPDGSYNFLVDSTLNQNYSIIIRNPKIEDQKAIQTWASANIKLPNRTIAYCKTLSQQRTVTGQCQNIEIEKSNSNFNLDDIKIRSDIVMTTDQQVAIADFAITIYKERKQGRVTFFKRK